MIVWIAMAFTGGVFCHCVGCLCGHHSAGVGDVSAEVGRR